MIAGHFGLRPGRFGRIVRRTWWSCLRQNGRAWCLAGDTAIDCVESAAWIRPSPKDERLGSLAGTEPALPWYAPEVDRQDGLANASPRANTQPAKIGTHQDRTINTRTLPGAAHDIVTPTRSFCRNRARRHGGLGECRRRPAQKHPDILAAKVRSTSDRTFDFDVTVSSPYDTPQRYADAFRVMGKDGEVHGERTLFHDHATEQPFTRDLYNVKIPREVRMVVIQGATSALAMAARPSRSCCPGGSPSASSPLLHVRRRLSGKNHPA